MTRLSGQLGVSRARNNTARSKFRKHKVILESVTQKRKNLRTILSFEANAPAGYTFIPAGNPRFTSACKETCRDLGLKIYTVTTTPHQNTHGLSQQVHRVGYHFPSTVVAKKCMELGLYISENGNVVPFEQFGIKSTTAQADADVPQITINTEARDVIRDLFPKIPDGDINQIVKTAFQKGQRKVGTAVELPLARRAQLAVVAHIRHVYTDYDKLLKSTSFQEARRSVEELTLEKLVQWRGDDESGIPELEDVFREVIVISDDEEDDTDESDTHGDNPARPKDRDVSVEVLSSQILEDKAEASTDNDTNHIVSPLPIRLSQRPLFSDYGFDSRPVHKASSKPKIDRRGFSRYQVWGRAQDRYREKLSGHLQSDTPSVPVSSTERLDLPTERTRSHINSDTKRPLTPVMERINYPSPPMATKHDHRPHSGNMLEHGTAYVLYDGSRSRPDTSVTQKAPHILQLPDGSVFRRSSPNVSSAPVFVAGPGQLSAGYHENNSKRVHSVSDRSSSDKWRGESPRNHPMLPSIERRDSPHSIGSSLQHKSSDPNILSHNAAAHSISHTRRPFEELSRAVDLIDLTDDGFEVSKRRRVESKEVPSKFYRSTVYREEPVISVIANQRTQPRQLHSQSRYVEPVPPLNRLDMGPSRNDGFTLHSRTISREELTDNTGYSPTARLRDPSSSDHLKLPGRAPQILDGSAVVARIENVPQYRDFNYEGDGYVAAPANQTAATSLRGHPPVKSHHARGAGSDDAVWRGKVNSYEAHRNFLDSQNPALSAGPRVMSSQSFLLPSSRSQGRARDDHGFAEYGQRHTEQVIDLTLSPPSENVHHRGAARTRRISSQPPVLEGQRKKDLLPASTLRRYEVQLERSMNHHRQGSAPFQ